MDLTVGGEHRRVDTRFVPQRFPGDLPTDCRLIGGPVVNLNVMWHRGAAAAPPSRSPPPPIPRPPGGPGGPCRRPRRHGRGGRGDSRALRRRAPDQRENNTPRNRPHRRDHPHAERLSPRPVPRPRRPYPPPKLSASLEQGDPHHPGGCRPQTPASA
ncbi:HutD family protein [Streptomyces sp. S1D4-11]